LTPEGYVLDAVMDYLAAKHIFAIRMQVGCARIDKRFVRFGVPGCADILAATSTGYVAQGTDGKRTPLQRVIWIECKAPNGKQSALQKSFQAQVEAQGHRYILARSIDDLEGL
jgi:hypothetical protein